MATKIRHEINILTAVLSAAGGSSATSNEFITIDTTKYNNATYYFEIVGDSSVSISFNVTLRRKGTSTDDATCNIPVLSTAYKRVRSSSFSPGGTQYVVFIDATAGATKNVKAARLIIIQEPSESIVTCQHQFEIGNNETGKTNTTSSPLTNPKLWYYDSAVYDGTLAFTVEALYSCSSTKNTCDITLQEDNGSFGAWTNLVTLVSAGAATVVTRVTISFTPTTGRHYRIASLGSTSKSTYSIYSAKIIIDQSSTAVIVKELAATGYISSANLLYYYKGEDVNDSKGSNNLTNSGAAFNTGLFNNAVDFGTTDSHSNALKTSTITSLNPATNSFYISFWFKFRTVPSGGINRYFIAIDNASGNAINIAYSVPNAALRIIYYGGGSNFSLTADTTNWYHVVATFQRLGDSGSVGNLYVNGVFRTSVTTAGMGAGVAGPEITIGNQTTGSTLSGPAAYMDDIAFFSSILTADDVKQLYFAGLTKMEVHQLLANTLFAAGTSQQDFDTLYDPAEWSGFTANYYHESNSVVAGTSDIKLQDTAGPTDITNSTITDIIERERTPALTMPVASATLDCIATSNNSNIYASRIVVQLSPISNPSYLGGTQMMFLGVGLM